MYFSIDRITPQHAVLVGEDAKTLEIPLSMLPQGAKPGQMLLYKNGAFQIDLEKTKERRQVISDALASLLHKKDE